jgi:hypothetical protein
VLNAEIRYVLGASGMNEFLFQPQKKIPFWYSWNSPALSLQLLERLHHPYLATVQMPLICNFLFIDTNRNILATTLTSTGPIYSPTDPLRIYTFHFLFFFSNGSTAPSRSHSDTPHSVGLLWTSDQPVAETSTWQHTTNTTQTSMPPGVFFVPVQGFSPLIHFCTV